MHPGKWRLIAKHVRTRQDQQCRERWLNSLDPSAHKWGLALFCPHCQNCAVTSTLACQDR